MTAESVGAYKPDPRNFEVALERIGLPRERILHVAQSLFHDHVPARRSASHGLDRSPARPAGVRRDAARRGRPDATFPDMASFAAAAPATATAG